MRESLIKGGPILMTGANAFNERTEGVGEGRPGGMTGRKEREGRLEERGDISGWLKAAENGQCGCKYQ